MTETRDFLEAVGRGVARTRGDDDLRAALLEAPDILSAEDYARIGAAALCAGIGRARADRRALTEAVALDDSHLGPLLAEMRVAAETTLDRLEAFIHERLSGEEPGLLEAVERAVPEAEGAIAQMAVDTVLVEAATLPLRERERVGPDVRMAFGVFDAEKREKAVQGVLSAEARRLDDLERLRVKKAIGRARAGAAVAV